MGSEHSFKDSSRHTFTAIRGLLVSNIAPDRLPQWVISVRRRASETSRASSLEERDVGGEAPRLVRGRHICERAGASAPVVEGLQGGELGLTVQVLRCGRLHDHAASVPTALRLGQ